MAKGTRTQDGRPVVRMSVRAVVETTLHESDLSPAAGAARRMREGALAHRARQKEGALERRDYRAEEALEALYETNELCLRVTGRADGVYLREDGTAVIEEIKLGAENPPLIPAHMAQAEMYGHMLCARDGLESVCIRVLYVDEHGVRRGAYDSEKSAQALEEAFCALCAPAACWEARLLARRRERDAALMQLPFPFDGYREGQRRFAANVYVAVKERRRLFAQAPTGIGKTMAALYPALLALGEGRCGRIAFLTARTTGRASAIYAMRMLMQAGASGVMTTELCAKDKVCPQAVRDCRPEVCPLAKGFYDRLGPALEEALGMGILGREEIERLAGRHGVCPFEMSLHLAAVSDVVVCDYNYVYDPAVAYDALMNAPGGTALLVDEAHQLAPRVRDAYSVRVSLEEVTLMRRDAGKAHGRRNALYRALTSMIHALREEAKGEAFCCGRMDAPPEWLEKEASRVLEAAAAQLAQGAGAAAADAFALAAQIQMVCGRFDERFAVLTQGEERRAQLDIVCLNAAPDILAASKRARGTVYFSATLAPFDASQRILGSVEGDACLALPSPFDASQLHAQVAPIDIRYAARERTAPDVAQRIGDHIASHAGNTIVYFPSYAYMNRIAEILLGMEGTPDMLREKRGMSEEEKNALLGAFDQPGNAVLLAVLGGAFSEGVDLPGDRLKNVIIVSTGLPQPDAQLRAMQAYYEENGADGFDLCMTLPGMIRVIQAAGRLIRTHEDTGTLLLIDSRFAYPRIRALLRGTLAGEALGIHA